MKSVLSFFSSKFFSDSSCFRRSEFFLEDEVHLSSSIEERHVERYSFFSFISIVFIVSIGDDELSIFDNPEFIRELIHEVTVMGYEEYRSFIESQGTLECFSGIIVEMISRLIENKEVV